MYDVQNCDIYICFHTEVVDLKKKNFKCIMIHSNLNVCCIILVAVTSPFNKFAVYDKCSKYDIT
jgi:hypothetical protein